MARPVIANIRPGDPDGNEWNLTLDTDDEFFAVNETDPSGYDALIAKLHTDLDLSDYGYVFLATNGDDTITGVTDDDPEGDISGVIAGGNGSDDITAGPGDHVIFAGNGRDTAVGGDGDDTILGENGKDQIEGQDGNDEVRGGAGNDKLKGGLGDDILLGHNGKDCLTGGEGADELTGGNGPDKFLWHETAEFGDVVTDFATGSDTLKFNVGAEDPEISIGNDDTVVDNFAAGDDAAINVADTEVGVKTDAEVADAAAIQTTIDGYVNIETGALFAFLDETEGHAVLYYDADPSTAGGAELVAEFTNITTLGQLGALSASDFVFV